MIHKGGYKLDWQGRGDRIQSRTEADEGWKTGRKLMEEGSVDRIGRSMAGSEVGQVD